ncbi:MAG: hypothetical protein ACLQPH_09785, partial [Acidimicrobiales bacterium]
MVCKCAESSWLPPLFFSLPIPASVGLLSNSSPAFASSTLTCAKVSGDFNTSITIRNCSVPSADEKTYKSASVVVS